MLVYINDCILMSSSDKAINKAITSLKASKQNFTIEDEASVGVFLGVKIRHNSDGTITLTQPQLINSILQDLSLQDNTKAKVSQNVQ